jgi:hypothetical protein
MLLIGFFSINTNATPNEGFIKKVPAFLLLAATQYPNVICKAIENSIISVSDSNNSNPNPDTSAQILSQNYNIEFKIDQISSLIVYSFAFTILTMLITCHANYRCNFKL